MSLRRKSRYLGPRRARNVQRAASTVGKSRSAIARESLPDDPFGKTPGSQRAAIARAGWVKTVSIEELREAFEAAQASVQTLSQARSPLPISLPLRLSLLTGGDTSS